MSQQLIDSFLKRIGEFRQVKSKQNDVGAPIDWAAYQRNVGYIEALDTCAKVIQELLSLQNSSR